MHATWPALLWWCAKLRHKFLFRTPRFRGGGVIPPTVFAINYSKILLRLLCRSQRSTKDSSFSTHPKTKLPEAFEKMPGLLGMGDRGWISTGCTITQEAHRRLPTAAQARFRPQDSLLWNFCRQNGNGTRRFLEDLPFWALFIKTPTIHVHSWAMEITLWFLKA